MSYLDTLTVDQAAQMDYYDRFHAKIYDLTRWSFLFGRAALIRHLARLGNYTKILEIGCGTGQNLVHLSRVFPKAAIIGVDASQEMLNVAKKTVNQKTDPTTWIGLVRQVYDAPLCRNRPFDLILFSYSLSMMNPGWERAIAAAKADLAPDGTIAVVDFHNSALPAFKQWMGVNHVRMESHLLANLKSKFSAQIAQTKAAYGGAWEYMTFIGQQKG